MNTTETLEQLKGISDIIKQRRTIIPKLFQDKTIDNQVVLELLENATWAPNHRKTEPWRFNVFSGASLEKLGDFFQSCYNEKFLNTEKYSEKKFKDLKTKVLKSSHVIAIGMQRDPDEKVPEWEELAAVACAVQNLWLSASAAGLGGYWSSPGYIMDQFSKLVALQEGERCLGFFYLGVPLEDLPLQSERRPIEEKVNWI